MGFKWKCPECEQVHEYGGNATTKATARCGSKNLKIWQYKIMPPKPPKKPPQATKYRTTIQTPSKASAQINLDYWEDMANWAINTIKYKKAVLEENMGSQVYRNYLRWVKQRDIIIKLKEEVEK